MFCVHSLRIDHRIRYNVHLISKLCPAALTRAITLYSKP